MSILLIRPHPGNERYGLGPFFRVEPLGLEYLAAGDTLDEFLDHFPTVEHEQVMSLLDLVQDQVLGPYEVYEVAA